VGAPPSSIGKFGGETDNWMYPRHTGDFSVFRIYTAPDGSPAGFNPGNIPYRPKKFLQVSLKGYKKGDFAMVMGFPGSTKRYITSYEVALARDNVNPVIIDAFDAQIKAMQKLMNKDSVLKLSLASNFAQFNNTYKYYLGQERQLKNSDLEDKKKQFELQLIQGKLTETAQGTQFNNTLKEIESLVEQLKKMQPTLGYYHYGLFQNQTLGYVLNFYPYLNISKEDLENLPKSTKDSIGILLNMVTKNYLNTPTLESDKEMLSAVLYHMFTNIPSEKRPDWINAIYKGGKDTAKEFDQFTDNLFKKSSLLNPEKVNKFYKSFSFKRLNSDLLIIFTKQIVDYYLANFATYEQLTNSLDDAHKKYTAEIMKLENNPIQYPDANSTLRVTYGSVLPYEPKDGIMYKYYTTYEGILDKSSLSNPEYKIKPELNKLLTNKKFGRYAQNDTLRINFITNTDITGGNSGSPVMDANGDLIGIAFDGDWESMISDLKYNPSTNRTICVDIRYVLWVMDVYAGAGNLVNEMKVIE
jgi:hypothetical protein